jgi:hypothetical protein
VGDYGESKVVGVKVEDYGESKVVGVKVGDCGENLPYSHHNPPP